MIIQRCEKHAVDAIKARLIRKGYQVAMVLDETRQNRALSWAVRTVDTHCPETRRSEGGAYMLVYTVNRADQMNSSC